MIQSTIAPHSLLTVISILNFNSMSVSQLFWEMTHILASILWPPSLLVCVFICRRWNAYTTFRAAAIQYRCQRPRKYPHWDQTWEHDLYCECVKAIQRGQLMKLYVRHGILKTSVMEIEKDRQIPNKNIINPVNIYFE